MMVLAERLVEILSSVIGLSLVGFDPSIVSQIVGFLVRAVKSVCKKSVCRFRFGHG